MKITLSRALFDASHATGQNIARVITNAVDVRLPDQLPDAENALQAMCSATAELVNVAVYESDAGYVVYEVDDKVMFAILRVYEKFASAIGMLVSIAKPLVGMLKGEMDEVERLANQRV